MAQILVIDDDSDILRLMQFALERAGFQVGLAVDGPQGLDMIKKQPPDLIIADVMMPEMTGYELTRRVRKMPNMEKLPIIIYSARFQPVDKQAALEAGATDYLPKTVSPTEIVKQVKQHLRQANVPTPATGLLAKSLTTAFFSLRGGVGVTSLAVNVAVALALSRKTPVGLTDLNPIAGHAGLMLNLHPKSHIYNILNSEKPISNAIVNQHFTPHASGVQLLASPLIAPEGATKHEAGQMIQHIRALLQYNIIDLPHTLTSATTKLLAEVDKLVLILSPDVPSLQSAAVALQLLPQRGLHLEQIVIVLNRNTPEAGLNVGAIQKTLRQQLAAEIPYEAAMLTAINSRKPLVLHSLQSPATTAIAKLAVSLLK